jgi:ubiquitin-like modifier-activating enzyme ATG7
MLSFDAPISRFEPSFWEQLYSRKLNEYKLDDGNVDKKLYCHSNLHSFSRDSFQPPGYDTARGSLIVLNNIEDFREFDKKALLQKQTAVCFSDMVSSSIDAVPAAVKDPSLLSIFTLLTFPDLKTYRFTYWFAAPVILPNASSPFASALHASSPPIVQLNDFLALSLYKALL